MIGFALVVLVGVTAGVAWIKLAPSLGFDGPSCSSSVQDPRHGGCVASLPIQDIAVTITSTVSLSPNGNTLLLGGPLRNDKTKVMLAGFNVAESRETWRAPLEGFVSDVKVSVSANGGKAAVWAERTSRSHCGFDWRHAHHRCANRDRGAACPSFF